MELAGPDRSREDGQAIVMQQHQDICLVILNIKQNTTNFCCIFLVKHIDRDVQTLVFIEGNSLPKYCVWIRIWISENFHRMFILLHYLLFSEESSWPLYVCPLTTFVVLTHTEWNYPEETAFVKFLVNLWNRFLRMFGMPFGIFRMPFGFTAYEIPDTHCECTIYLTTAISIVSNIFCLRKLEVKEARKNIKFFNVHK